MKNERKSSWIRRRQHTIVLASGGEEGKGWAISVKIETKNGRITTPPDNPSLGFKDKVKHQYRCKDRAFFVRHCGKEYMKDKEVDHAWGSNPIWAFVVPPEVNGGRHEVCTAACKSFVETEEWIEEMYKGRRR